MKAWLLGLSVGKKIALAVGSFLAVSTIAGAIAATPTPPIANVESKKPVVVIKDEKKTEPVKFKTESKEDPSLNKGETTVTREGVNGERTLNYKVTYTDGVETDRELISETLTKEPINKVVFKGTYVAPKPAPAPPSNCDPNYTPCVPKVSYDLDCPDVGFTVSVIGSDVHRFDRDGDGYGCE